MELSIFSAATALIAAGRRADMVHPAILLRAQKERRPGDAA